MGVRLAFGVYPQKCSLCRGPMGSGEKGLRARWGCDGPTQSEQDRLPCFACNDDVIDCESCHDARYLPLYRCPKAIRDPHIDEVVRIAVWSKENHLPIDGGLLEQSASFMAAREIVIAEIAKLEAEELKKANSDATE